MGRKWTTEQRAQQAEKIRQWQPWKYSTGAKTIEGKRKVSRNAFKGGFRVILQNAARYLREQKKLITS